MSDWISKAIEGSANRTTEKEYRLLREATYQRLFPAIETSLREQIISDVDAYNGHFASAPSKQLTLAPAGRLDLDVQKVGEPPTGSVSVHFDQAYRSILTTLNCANPSGDDRVIRTVTYDIKLEDEHLIVRENMKNSDGAPLSIQDLSRKILEPLFVAVS